MGILTLELQERVRQLRHGFVATVNADGTPCLCPHTGLGVFDGDYLVLPSPANTTTLDNVRARPVIEAGITDPWGRSHYHFRGVATVVTHGEVYELAQSACVAQDRQPTGGVVLWIWVMSARAMSRAECQG